MIDEVTVVHKGGLVLWKHSYSKVKGNPVSQLIKTVILEDRTGDGCFTHDTYKVEWLLENELELIFVVVYQHLLALNYISDLLDALKGAFVARYNDALVGRSFLNNPLAFIDPARDFTDEFKLLLKDVEAASEELRIRNRKSKQAQPKEELKDKPEATLEPSSPSSPTSGDRPLSKKAEQIARNRAAREQGASRKKTGGKAVKKPPPKKVARQAWNSTNGGVGGDNSPYIPDDTDAESKRVIEVTHDPVADPSNLDGDWAKEEKPRSRFTNFLRDRFGNREIDDQDLDTILPNLRDQMTSKNVAQEIADSLCSSTRAELTGKKIANFTSLSTYIKESLTASLLRILSPKKDVNILRDVAKAKEQGRPYTIAFCGVNGVGKSTNLSKVAYWLRGNGLSVLIAACDTFRSGAVEQLKVHSGRIGVPVFDKGYAKDAAEVAKDGIYKAKKEGFDVVLVDTAGRMQDNEPLMRSLAKLIHINKPDLVLFVGEALVGNDGIDQLKKFNYSLVKHTPPGDVPRGIDGIVLTKFDTIDDKVGAAVSMVYQSGQPIVFVGVGQDYQDLRTLNPNVVVSSILD
eukprot:TRINITY_DN71_c3_g2_i1.p1 TRINITY_DN71_c3_g2~~TRINITY_DN71_c3_g2_i1.p1  ORF type:complete len:574 (+),score=139.84 TRINITY_DN71_c3_g2_i1:38-1759(+)